MTYNNIEVMKGLEIIRHRPGQFVGDFIENNFNSAPMNILREIVGNSVDEFMSGHCDKITVFHDIDTDLIMVKDNGRGIPFSMNKEEGVSNLQLACGQMYAGAKYNKDQEESAFKFAIGQNGVGLTACNALSSTFKITSIREEGKGVIHYSKGEIVEPFKKTRKLKSDSIGTSVRWKLDDTILPQKYFLHFLKRYFQQVAYLNAGLTIEFMSRSKDASKGYQKTYREPKGINAYLATRIKNSTILVDSMSLSGKIEGSYEFDIALALTSASTEDIHPFINGNGIDESSAPVVALRKGFAKAVKEYLTVVADIPKRYFDKSGKIIVETSDCRAGMVSIIKMLHIDPAFDSQSKTKLINKDISKFISETVPTQILGYLQKHPDQASKVVAQVLIQADARIASKKARTNVLTHKVKKHSELNISLDIYTPPLERDPKNNSLYIFEGQSASGSLVKASKAKNPDTNLLYKNNVGILAFKGMALNTLELDISRVLKNKEFATLVDVSGLNPNNPSDLSKLNFNRFIIACDSDPGGSHISTLILTFFFKHFPKVIEEGKLFRVDTPLFELKNLKTKDLHFIYAEESKEDRIKELGFKLEDLGKAYTLKRNKGLGEMSDKANLTLVENPKLQEFKTNDIKSFLKMFYLFSGKDHIQDRKDLIFAIGLI